MNRPESHQVGPFVVRRDATHDTWRVFRDSAEVFVDADQVRAMNWAITNSPARSIGDVNPLVGWGL